MKTLICDCNRTMPLDVPALSQALTATPGASPDGLETTHTLLCRREAGAFQRAAKATGEAGEPLLVACTQESRLFVELNAQTEGAASIEERPIRFVNIRETGGWSRDGARATPKIAALLAAAQLPMPAPVPTVSYRSGGRCLIVGPADAAERAAELLADKLDVSLLIDRGGALAQAHRWAVHSGRLTRLAGWLGAFEAQWERGNPIDLDLCTRCNACLEVCPEGAIDFSYQIDLEACKSHRECVRVCAAAGAIDFERAAETFREHFDLVLDLREQRAFTMHQPPQGYFHTGSDERALMKAVLELRELTGEFEKPRFFAYQQRLCAHSRNEQIGCTACIDVCSAQAIRSDASLKGKPQGKQRGGPEGAITGAAKPTGGIGLDLWLAAIAQGASQVWVLLTDEEAPHYRAALAEQMAVAQALLNGLGYAGRHFALIEARDARDLLALDAALREPPAAGVARAATFAAQADKRATLELALDHLVAQAPTPVDEVPLPAASPFGSLVVDTNACTLCLSCVE